MRSASLHEIVTHCDRLLRPAEFDDWPGAANGLQMQNAGQVTRLAAAVDASLATVKLAGEAGADLLVVHHGLFWSPTHPWTGKRFELIKQLLDQGLAVYAAHLPLDAHPELGNNVLLGRALGWRKFEPFFFTRGRHLGLRVRANIDREALARSLGRVLGCAPRVLPGGPQKCRRIGIVTGGAGAEIRLGAAEGVDTFITGEGPHWTFALAEELGLNVFYGGHYATETFGVKALTEHLSRKFHLPWSFLDHPTGL